MKDFVIGAIIFAAGMAFGIYAGQSTCAKPANVKPANVKPHTTIQRLT